MTSAVRLEEPIPISQKVHADTAEPKSTKSDVQSLPRRATRVGRKVRQPHHAVNVTGGSWRSSVRWSPSSQSAE